MRNLAVAVTDIDFIMLDINQCSQADFQLNSLNLFAGTHKCKPTTRCEPLFGFGFRRGGYQCLCQPGYRYPIYQDGPFKGYIIEQATQEEYENNFDCLKIELHQQMPEHILLSKIELLMSRSWISVLQIPILKRSSIEQTRWTRVESIMNMYDRLNFEPDLCEYMTENELTLPGDVLFDVNIQFESQARLALTISHFLSSFYQIVNTAEDFPLRQAESDLTEEQLIGEVLAAAGADFKVVGVGIFFDRGKFPQHHLPYFGPYAYRIENGFSRTYRVVDWAGLPGAYENELWFRVRRKKKLFSMKSKFLFFVLRRSKLDGQRIQIVRN